MPPRSSARLAAAIYAAEPIPASPVMAGRLGGGGAGSGGVSAPVEDTGPRMDFQFSGLPLAEATREFLEMHPACADPAEHEDGCPAEPDVAVGA